MKIKFDTILKDIFNVNCKKQFIIISQNKIIKEYINKKYYNFLLKKKSKIDIIEIITFNNFLEKCSGLKIVGTIDLFFQFLSIIKENNFSKTEFKKLFLLIPELLNIMQFSDNYMLKNVKFLMSCENYIKNYNKYYDLLRKKLLKYKISYKEMLLKYCYNNFDKIYNKVINKKVIFFFIERLSYYEKIILKKFYFKNKITFYEIFNNDKILKNNHTSIFCCKKKNKIKNKKNTQIFYVNNEIEQIRVIEKIINKYYGKMILIIPGNKNLLDPLISFFKHRININISYDIKYPFNNILIKFTFDKIFKLLYNPNNINITEFIRDKYIEKLFIKNSNCFHYLFRNKFDILNYKKYLSNRLINFLNIVNIKNNTKKLLRNLLIFIKIIKNKLVKYRNNNFLELKFIEKIECIIDKMKIICRRNTNWNITIKDVYIIYKKLINTFNIEISNRKHNKIFITEINNYYIMNFDVTIILSCNNGIIPPYKHHEIYIENVLQNEENYYQYLNKIQNNSKKLILLYKTNYDNISSGEPSPILNKLFFPFFGKKIKTSSYLSISQQKSIIITKNKLFNQNLEKIKINGISPSTIRLYNYNPILFYINKILKIKNFIVQTSKMNLGKLIHKILNNLYNPFIGKTLTLIDINNINKNIKCNIIKYLSNDKYYINQEDKLLFFYILNNYIKKFIQLDENSIQKGDQIIIRHLEYKLSFFEKKNNIKLHGIIDRIDEYNTITRIIDYKIGFNNITNMKIIKKNITQIFINPYYSNIMQLIFYALLWFNSNKNNIKICPKLCIISPTKTTKKFISEISVIFNNIEKISFLEYIEIFYPMLIQRISDIISINKIEFK